MKLSRSVRPDHVHGISLEASRTESGAFIGVLVVAKLLRSFGLFSAAEILKSTPVVLLVGISTAISAVVFTYLQKPFQGGIVLRQRDYQAVCKHSLLYMLETLLFTIGLMLVGPLRAIIISEHSQWSILATRTVCTQAGHVPSYQLRCAQLGIAAFAIIVLFDNPSNSHSIDHVEREANGGVQTDYHTVRHDKYFGWLFVSDRTAAMFLLLLSACIRILRENFGKKVGSAIGGAKRLHAISSIVSAAIWVPLAVLEAVIGSAASVDHAFIYQIGSMLIYTATSMIVNFYAEKATATKLRPESMHSISLLYIPSLKTVCEQGVLEDLWQKDESVEVSTIISSTMILVGQYSWHRKRSQSVSKGDAGSDIGLGKRSLIGYAADGLPLYSFSRPRIATKSFLNALINTFKQAQESSESRQILFFLCVNFALMTIEFVSGLFTNNLGLVSDAFHLLFDCVALLIALYAAITARSKAPKTFPFGYGRVEVLSGFTNSILLVAVGFSIFLEGICRLSATPELHSESLIYISAVGLMVNTVGLFSFSHAKPGKLLSLRGSFSKRAQQSALKAFKHQLYGTVTPTVTPVRTTLMPASTNGRTRQNINSPWEAENGQASNSASIWQHTNPNLHGVLLHVLGDAAGCLGTILSAVLVEQTGWTVLDPIIMLVVGIAIIASVMPLLSTTCGILLNRVPESVSSSTLVAMLGNVTQLEGVVGYREVHIWEHSPSVIIGTIHVIVAPASSEQRVLNQVTGLFQDIGISNLTVQVEAQGMRASKTEVQVDGLDRDVAEI